VASLALRAFCRAPKREPRAAPLALVKPETASWDAVVERLLASWGSLGPVDETALYLAGWPEDRREDFEERAGVLEEGGLSRQEAERRALAEVREGYNVHKVHNGNVRGGTAA